MLGRRLARNTLFSGVSEGSTILLFLLGFVAARELGPLAFGEYCTAAAFVGLFRILPDFGMSYASTVAISRDRSIAERWAGNLLGFQSLLSLVTLMLCLSLGWARYSGDTFVAVVVLSVALVLTSFKVTLRWLLKSFDRFGAEAVSLVIERVLILVLGLFALRGGGGVTAFVLVFALVRLPDTAGLWAWVSARVVPLRLRMEREVWRQLFFKGLPFAYVGATILLFFQVDQLILEAIRGATEVGWYGAPVKVLEGLTVVPRVLGYAFIPTMAALHTASPSEVKHLYRQGSHYLLLVGLPIAVFGALASDVFIPVLFGPRYLPSVPAARVLIPSCAFMFLSNFSETTLVCIDRMKTVVFVSTASLVLNLALNLLWIPRYGYMGAAWATLVTEGVYFLLTALSLLALKVSWGSLLLRPAIAGSVFALALFGVRRLLFGLGPEVALLGAAGSASLLWLGTTLAIGAWRED